MDKYDKAIEYLTQNPDKIYINWMASLGEAWCLFQSTGNDLNEYGCLTQIRSVGVLYIAPTPELTKAIRADERIPFSPSVGNQTITLAHLPIFAEWQRRLDKELGRPI